MTIPNPGSLSATSSNSVSMSGDTTVSLLSIKYVFCTRRERVLESHVISGWNPQVRSILNELNMREVLTNSLNSTIARTVVDEHHLEILVLRCIYRIEAFGCVLIVVET